MLELRPYQENLIKSIRNQYIAGHRAVCLQLQTGAGKTAIAARICNLLCQKHGNRKGGTMLFIAHRRELLKQIADTLNKFGLQNEYGFIQSGRAETPWAQIQIASIQTIARRLHKLKINPAMICIDEFHHAAADSYKKVRNHFHQARLLGLTATPIRLDGKGLKSMAETMICGPSPQQLTEHGFLCEVDTFSIPNGIDMSGVAMVAGDYNKKESDKRATGKVIANALDNWLKFTPNKKTIHYAVSRRHSKEFVAQAKERGIAAEHVDGTMSDYLREGIMRRFLNDQTMIISNVDIISEGFDCPNVECVLLGRLTKSLAIYLQQCGRVMRPKPNGAKGIILDVAGNFRHFGNPDNDRNWSLADGLDADIEQDKKRIKKKNKKCDCGFVFPATFDQCPACNEYTTQTVQEVDLELILSNDKQPKQTKPKPKLSGKDLNSMVFKTMGDIGKLQDVQRRYGYSNGVIKIWQTIYGEKWRSNRQQRGEK